MLCALRPILQEEQGDCLVQPDSLQRQRVEEGDLEASERCVTYLLDDAGSFVSYETPSTSRRRRTSGIAKVSFKTATVNGRSLLSCSSISRNNESVVARLKDSCPPGEGTDAEILLFHVKAALARARWRKVATSLNGLRLMRPSASRDEGEMYCLPNEAVVKRACKEISGTFGFVFLDVTRRGFVFAARSLDASVPLFWMRCPKCASLLFSSERTAFPPEICTQDFDGKLWGTVPPGSFFCGSPASAAPPTFVHFDQRPEEELPRLTIQIPPAPKIF
ncbi:hypothetical protein CYMTET_28407 [Cymbomonas tetramitiformis]|uniref:Uncharacterized protein n=1 Tax=Cymbomonas tetramitiformis TaxID=36881 RepID=A0AAE0FMW6_9CHLO|nr:hypothetical protein CYMTET_28407 [Cymbomonas tetramitiformis]